MAGYWNSPNLVFTSGGRVQRGYRTLLERYRATYGKDAELGRLDFSELEVHALGHDAAWVLGRWRLARSADTLGGVFTLVLRRIDGGWKIVHDHTSGDAPPPATRPTDARRSDPQRTDGDR
jgi:ketosteroid isomerase-like protein